MNVDIGIVLNRIDALLPTLKHGWCSMEKAGHLAATIFALRPSVVVEIGVWGGRSLLPMAMALKATGQGQMIGIDPWEPAESVKGQEGEHLAWWRSVDHELVHGYFMEHLRSLKLDNVLIHRLRSDDVEPPESIGVLHIDGNHGEQMIRDVYRFASRVQPGGFCFCDDLGWEGGAGAVAVDSLAGMGFVRRYDCDTGAMFQRVR